MNHLVDQYFDSLIDKKIAVLGIGVSNRPLIRMLLARGLHVLACDKTPREKLDAEVLELERAGTVLHVGEHYLDDVQADIVFRTPGMHPDIPALRRLREKGAELTSEMEAFFEVYREKLMAILKQPASRKNHTNVLMHIQGYFRDQLNSRQRGELREVILNYRAGLLPILAPLTLLKHYLAEYPDRYLQAQNYFDPYPQDLALRLTVN